MSVLERVEESRQKVQVTMKGSLSRLDRPELLKAPLPGVAEALVQTGASHCEAQDHKRCIHAV